VSAWSPKTGEMIKVWDAGKLPQERLFHCMDRGRFVCRTNILNRYYCWEFAEPKELPWNYHVMDRFPNVSPMDMVEIVSTDGNLLRKDLAGNITWNDSVIQWRKTDG